MIFKIGKASNWNYEEEIEIKTLEDLLEFIDSVSDSIVIETKHDNYSITIYDDYLE